MSDEAPEFDVNTDEGFNQALAAATGKELSSEQRETLQGSDRSVSAGLEIPEESAPQPRDEAGRFAPAAPTPPAQEEVAPTQEQPPADDPIAALVAEHGGDAEAALAALVKEREGAQSLLGRHGQEVGELREQLAELRGRLEATPAAPPTTAPTFVPLQQIEQSILESENPELAAAQAMSWVVENGSDQDIDATLRVWAQVDPVGASDFSARRAYYQEMQRNQAAAPQAPQVDENAQWVAQQRLTEEMKTALGAALETVPAEDRSLMSPHIAKAWQEAPDFLKKAVADPTSREAALSSLVGTARAQLVSETIAQGKAKQSEIAQDAKNRATVISGANANPLPSEGGAAGERTPEEVSKALRDALLATDTTSVSAGLEYPNR